MYYIYEIPGVKIGVTSQPEVRLDMSLRDYDAQIIEEYEDIYEASDREIELQKEKGYRVEKIPYWKFIQTCSAAGKKGSRHMQREEMRQAKSELLSNYLKKAGKIKRTCPHCGTEGKGQIMLRWHFDNCKKKK